MSEREADRAATRESYWRAEDEAEGAEERRVAGKPDEAVIFEGDPAWKLILAGPVASIIATKTAKPKKSTTAKPKAAG